MRLMVSIFAEDLENLKTMIEEVLWDGTQDFPIVEYEDNPGYPKYFSGHEFLPYNWICS